MKIRYITCSDMREDTPIEKAVELLGFWEKAELGIQVHPLCHAKWNAAKYLV